MIIQIEVGIIALALVVLVGVLVPVLIQLGKTVEASERLLQDVNRELPLFLREATETVHNLNKASTDVREGAEKAKQLGRALGAIGETVNQVHGAVRNGAASLALNAGGVMAGVRAAVHVLTKSNRGNNSHGDGSSSNY
jgi:uncharacterized protein YoxC